MRLTVRLAATLERRFCTSGYTQENPLRPEVKLVFESIEVKLGCF